MNEFIRFRKWLQFSSFDLPSGFVRILSAAVGAIGPQLPKVHVEGVSEQIAVLHHQLLAFRRFDELKNSSADFAAR